MNIIFELNLNNTEKIILQSECPAQEIFFCDDIEIGFLADQEYRLSYDCLQYTLRGLINCLDNVIKNKLILHSSIQQDLGYMWNEESSGSSKLNFILEEVCGTDQWVGEKYILWSAPGNFNPRLTTWLYNNDKGEIILEITPSYRWHFQDPKPGEKYCTYEEFIKDYKPVLFRTIPKEVALDWITQATKFLSEVESRN